MQKRNSLFLILVCILICTSSCDSKSVFDEYQSLPNQWSKDHILNFNFEAPDTINAYNLYVNLRANNDYKFNNLYLITGLEYPNGKIVIDTLEYKMAEPSGELLGEGFTDVKESKLWYKGYQEPFKFKESGTYSFKVEQAMRKFGQVNGIDNLKGITEVGFRVENK